MYDNLDWCDNEAVDKVYIERSKKYLDMFRTWITAKKGGNKKTMKRTWESMSKYKEENEEFKLKAKQYGYHWS